MARFRYLALCLTHRCPGHPNSGPLYMALHTPSALPSELDPALRTHLREHFGVHATVYPHRGPAAAPMYLHGSLVTSRGTWRPIGCATSLLAVRSAHRNVQLCTRCLLCGGSPETAQYLWECPVRSHEWWPARQRLHTWLSTYVGPQASWVPGRLGDPAVLEQWSVAIATLSMQAAHMGLAGPHDMGTEFIRRVLAESQKVWLAHDRAWDVLVKARAGPGGTMAWALRELQLHQQAERQASPGQP